MSSEKKPLINNYVKTLGFISGIILAISVTVSILNIRDTNKTFLEYETSTILINKLDYVLSIVKDAETGQRGYIITGDKAFLEPFKSAQLHIDKELGELSDLMRSKNVQQELVDSLQILVKRKMRGTLRTKMYAEKVHFNYGDSLRRRLLKGKDTMNKIRQMVRELKEREQTRFELKKKEANGKTVTSIYIIIISTSASLLIFMLLLFNLNKTVKGQREAEKLLLESQLSLEQQVYKLHLSNKELEQFAYVASHDLQEPLRKIISFNERIQEMLSGNSEIKPYLERMSKSATRMRTLIQDLLNFSRSTKPVNMDETVDLNVLFTTVLEDLDNIISSNKAKIFIDRMPEVKGNSTQLRQLFQNLLSNALKFSKPEEEPYIHITYDQVMASDSLVRNLDDFTPKHETYLLISVADNGIGFDSRYAEQIFVIFQRLHGRSEYEGTGIGLSVVKKIIENHGGFITAKSEPGKGATFIVGLPLK